MSVKSTGQLWEELGALDELDLMQVVTKLFTHYETVLERDPSNAIAGDFFHQLGAALSQTSECNLNRR